MRKKTNVFLFGAGATLPWGSPLTSELTRIIRDSGFTITNNEIRITDFIFQILTSAGYESWEANFESIINVIEELTIYYSDFNSEKGLPSLLSAFFDSKYSNELLNFSTVDGKRTHGYKLQIPKGVDYDFAKPAYNQETPEQSFFIHLINNLLTEINARITQYAYHSPNKSNIITSETDSINKLFINWMAEHAENGTIRMYTLNYDRVFKILLERNNIRVFEGFDCGEFIDYNSLLKPDIKKILTDTDSHIHYNLHGSSYWEVNTLSNHDLPNYEINLTGAPVMPINNDPLVIQVEKGKSILVTPIITGYQKAQKAMLTPFKQMQASFDRDCCLADKLYVVGYSFGDEHINASIKTALQHNPNLQIITVDPNFKKNNLDLLCALKVFPYSGHIASSAKDVMQDLTNNISTYCNDVFWAYTMNFEDFLKLETQDQRYRLYKNAFSQKFNN